MKGKKKLRNIFVQTRNLPTYFGGEKIGFNIKISKHEIRKLIGYKIRLEYFHPFRFSGIVE